MLRFVHGLSLEETAAVLNDEPSRIKARQMRALKKLRHWLGAPAATPARATLPARPPDA